MSMLIFTILGAVAGSLLYTICAEQYGATKGMLISASVFVVLFVLVELF